MSPRASLSASLNRGNFPVLSSHLTSHCDASLSAVIAAKSRPVRSAIGAISPSRSLLCWVNSWHSLAKCSGVSLASPQLHLGVATPGFLQSNRNAFRPIFPVRTCISRELWCLIRSLCFSSTLLLNVGPLSAASMPQWARCALAVASLLSQHCLHALVRASSVFFTPVVHHSCQVAVCSPSCLCSVMEA